MFEKSRTWQRYKGPSTKVVRIHLGYVPDLETDSRQERSTLRTALAAAIVFHLALFAVHLPDQLSEPDWSRPERPIYAVKPIRFQPPPPAQQSQIPKRKEKRRMIPIPDPTPNEPEPVRVEEIELPEVEIVDLDLVMGIPEAPPARGLGGPGSGPLQVSGDVTPPVKIFSPSPPYTEEARQGRVQGIVILETVIDTLGNVDQVKVLKGLPMGLSESAVEAARRWKFKPATKGGGPVPVFFHLTIRFSLQ